MTIKELFMSFLAIILEPYPEYEIVTDCQVDICKYGRWVKTGGHTYECELCERKSDGLCNGCMTHKAEVGIENPSLDYYEYFVFTQRPDRKVKNSIHYISSQKHMFGTLSRLKDDFYWCFCCSGT